MKTDKETAPDADLALVRAAVEGKQSALERLVDRLTPVIQARVARCLMRYKADHAAVRQDVEDLTQDVFLYLFSDNGKTLLSWTPERGMSLRNFVGLIAERQAVSKLRTGKHGAWREQATDDAEALDSATSDQPAEVLGARDLLDTLLARMREKLSPLGFHLFELLYIQDRTVQEVCDIANLTSDAVYAWRSRLRKTARALHEELAPSTLAAGNTRPNTPHTRGGDA